MVGEFYQTIIHIYIFHKFNKDVFGYVCWEVLNCKSFRKNVLKAQSWWSQQNLGNMAGNKSVVGSNWKLHLHEELDTGNIYWKLQHISTRNN